MVISPEHLVLYMFFRMINVLIMITAASNFIVAFEIFVLFHFIYLTFYFKVILSLPKRCKNKQKTPVYPLTRFINI